MRATWSRLPKQQSWAENPQQAAEIHTWRQQVKCCLHCHFPKHIPLIQHSSPVCTCYTENRARALTQSVRQKMKFSSAIMENGNEVREYAS